MATIVTTALNSPAAVSEASVNWLRPVLKAKMEIFRRLQACGHWPPEYCLPVCMHVVQMHSACIGSLFALMETVANCRGTLPSAGVDGRLLSACWDGHRLAQRQCL